MSKNEVLSSEYKKCVRKIKALKGVIRKYSFDDERLVSDTQLLIILRAQRDSLSRSLSN